MRIKRKSNKKENKKVKNATPNTYNGIQFKSQLETYVYKQLKAHSLKADYEPIKFELIPSFVFCGKKIRAMTYTPDFIVEKNNHHFVLEVKGMPTDRYVVKRKLFLNYLKTQPTWHFFEVHTKRDMIFCIQKIKEYEYSSPENKKPSS